MGIHTLGRPAVFLDRDGVLNRTFVRNGIPHPPATLAELEILPGVPEALERLAAGRFWLLVVTNQPDVARGQQQQSVVEAINQALSSQLPLDGFFTCFHDNADACPCRKPKPGLILEAARQFEINLAASFLVGDRWSDIVAGAAAGCRTILLDQPYSHRERCQPDFVSQDLFRATELIHTLL
ncbi:MAG: HAD family hydrolase [Blastocatellia bacterium]|nr:HAD family hydrolase [Blastocatellia bacterium]